MAHANSHSNKRQITSNNFTFPLFVGTNSWSPSPSKRHRLQQHEIDALLTSQNINIPSPQSFGQKDNISNKEFENNNKRKIFDLSASSDNIFTSNKRRKLAISTTNHEFELLREHFDSHLTNFNLSSAQPISIAKTVLDLSAKNSSKFPLNAYLKEINKRLEKQIAGINGEIKWFLNANCSYR